MFEKLEQFSIRFYEIEKLISDPEVISKQSEYKKLTKEHSDLTPIVDKYNEYKKIAKSLEDAEKLILTEKDSDMKDLLYEEIGECRRNKESVKEELVILLLPKDPNDDKNVILEIRGGAGGDEAALFAYELLRMYIKYAEKNRWKVEEINLSETEIGGLKEAIYMISGFGAYSRLKYESGVHRVQRIPETEAQGRVHTSTVTVAVLPEAEEVDVEISDKDLRIDTYRSSGAGGQHVNKTDSAIRITHEPTGIVVACQDERSQLKNKEKAMRVLKSKLYDHYNEKAVSEYAATRKMQVGTGDRSERIRTYNFPQGRITDHRVNISVYDIESYMLGDLDQMIDALAVADRNAKLNNSNV